MKNLSVDQFDRLMDEADLDALRRRRAPKPQRSDQFVAARERKLTRDEWERQRNAARRFKRNVASAGK